VVVTSLPLEGRAELSQFGSDGGSRFTSSRLRRGVEGAMAEGSLQEEGTTAGELIRVRLQSEHMADGETVRWAALCRCGALLGGERGHCESRL